MLNLNFFKKLNDQISLSKKTIVFALLLVFSFTSFNSQGQVSLTFSNGYLGTQNSAVQSTSNIKNFASLGIARVSFGQSYSGTFGGTQGNDLAGVIKFYLTSGRVISLNGALNWRETTGNTVEVFGLIIDAGQNATITYGSNQTYNIVGGSTGGSSTSIGLRSYTSSLAFTDGESRNGNAATSGIIANFNTELANTPQPSSISLTNSSVIEGQNLVYTVTLSTATTANRPQVYTFNTSGIAIKGTDYNGTYTFSNGVVDNGDGTITVPGSISSFTITVNTTDDLIVENIENLYVYVGSKVGLGSIADNDNSSIANCDPNSLYDNIVSGYHQSIAKKSDGTFAVWGGLMASNGSSYKLTPTTINSINYPGLVGTPLKTALAGAASSSNSQAILLTTDGLYAWGSESNVLDDALTSSDAFAKIITPTGGDASTKLPTGVTPGSVKMMVAFYKTLVLVTNAGNVWVLTQVNGELRGVGSNAGASTTWNKVKINSNTDLSNVISVRGMVDDANYNALMALTADGKAYVWGKTVYLADGNGVVTKNYATQMVLPTEFNETNLPKMIAVTGGNKTSSLTCNNTFYILSNGGSLYAVGDNQKKQIGDFTTTERKIWTRVKINSTTDFTNINYISAMESDPSDPAVVAITKAGVLYTWGFNPRNMIGRPTANIAYDPGVPAGFLQGTDKAIFAEMGGHTLVYIKEGSTQFCYVGHRVDGSMGDGTNTDADEVAFNCSGTPSLAVCGSVPVAASTTTSTITANPTSIAANGITTSIITVQLKQTNGTNLTSTGGTVVITTNKGTISNVTDNNDGTYTAILTSSTFVEAATLNYTLNGVNGTNNASVNFTAATNPVLTATGTLKTFTSCSGCTVAPQSFTVSGVDLSTNNIVVTAPTGFQVSTNVNSGFATSINIAPTSGTVTTTTVYTKLTNNATTVASGVITVASTGAASKTVTVTTNTDNALSFDGTNDFVNIPDNDALDLLNAFTIEAWVNPSSTSGSQVIIGKIQDVNTGNAADLAYGLRIGSGVLRAEIGDGTGAQSVTTNNVVANKWQHIAMVFNGATINGVTGSLTLYVDGVKQGNTLATGYSTLKNVSTSLKFGAYGQYFTQYYTGLLDNVKIWNTVKSDAEILSGMNTELNGNETGLVAFYNFNSGTANGTNTSISTIEDRSANAFTGTLTNFAKTGSTSNFVLGTIPPITVTGNATIVVRGNTLQLSNGLTGGVWASSNASFATVDASTGLVSGVADGTLNITYTICDKTVSYALTVVTPIITTSGTLKTFTSCSGCTVAPQTFTVSAVNLGANLVVAPPTGFEVATTLGGTYSSTLSLVPSSGTVATTTIYTRLINNASSAVGGNFNITSTGATTRTFATTVNTDNALMLDHAGYVNLGDVLDNTNLANTTEAWVYWKGSSEAFSEIFTKDVIQAFAITSSNKLHTNFGDGSNWISGLNSTTSIPLNTWTHVAVTRSSTGVVKMYINGVLDASTNTMNVTGNNTALRSIGGKNVNGGMFGLFTGAIDNLKVWNVEKSGTEIANGLYTELAGNETDLLAYYDFNQGIARGTNTSISTLIDKGPSAFNGTITAVTLTGTSSNFVDGSIPNITAAGNASTILAGGTLALSNGLTGGVWSSSDNNIATINASTGVVTGVGAGNAIIRYQICSKVVAYGVTVLVPSLTTGTLKTFTSCSGCTIPAQTFTVAGTNLGSNVVVTAPSGFEVSNASAGTYSATLSLTPTSGTLATTNVYARLINNATTASNGNFTVASTGAASKTVTATVNTDNALNFDGTNDYVILNSSLASAYNNNSVTIEAWIKTTDSKLINEIFALGSSTVYNNVVEFRTSGGKLQFILNDGVKFYGLESTGFVNTGKWMHVAVVKSGTNIVLYVNGQLASGSPGNGSDASASPSLDFAHIGVLKYRTSSTNFAFINGSNFSGGIDQLRVWNTARTISDIAANMYVEMAGNETGLVANYDFNQGVANGSNTSISTVNGRTTTPYNGTLTNFALTGTNSNFVTGFITDIVGASILNKGLTTTYTDGLTGGAWSSSNTNIATVNSTTGVVTGVNPGTSTITYTICEKTVSKLVTIVVPTITKSGTLTAFNTCLGTASAAQTFTVSAQYLTANLVLTAPTGYELSTDGATYTSTLSIAPVSGTVSARSIYIRLSTASVNGQSGNISITSTDATTQNMATGNATVTRTVAASVTISSNATNNSICAGTNVVFTATPTNGGNAPTYQWKLNGNSITGANSATYSTTALTNNDVVTVLMGSSLTSCLTGSPATSNSITTTVTSIPVTPGNITGQSVICMNSNQVYSVVAVPGATSYTWVVTGDLTATTSTTNVLNLTSANNAGSGTIKVLANNACGSSVYSNVFSVTVSNQPAPTANFSVSGNTVCLTNAGVTFTSTSTPNASTNSAIATYAWTFGDGTTATTATTSNTYTSSGIFDAILTIEDANQCTSSISRRITVDPISVAGTATVANATICEGANTNLNLTGYTGAIQWQSSTDGINFTNITGATSATYTTANLTATTYYQALVTSGTCSAVTSGVVTVTVSPIPAVTLSSVANVYTNATSFDLIYNNAVGTPDEYSINAVGPNALPNFNSITNFGLIGSPITVAIPASTIGTYNFNLLVKNGSIGCVSNTIPFTITIAPQPPAGLSYTTPNVYLTGTSITPLNPTSTGGVISQYSIGPSLPAGLTINPTTGVISGTPSAVSTQTSYTVTGTNASGTVTATVVITVNSSVVPQPQGSIEAVDYGLLAADTVKLKLTTSNGTAPFTLILSNSANTIKDTISNLTPVNNEIEFLQKRLDTTKVFTIYKLIDANNNTRTTGFTKDTTIVRLLKPQILLTLKADPAVRQDDNSFKIRLLMKIKNAGQLNLRNVQVNANLSTVFPSNITYVLDSVRVLSGGLVLNPNYSGAGSATSASSAEWISSASSNSTNQSYSVLDGNYLFNSGVSLNQAEEGEVAYYVSIGATAQNVVLKLQFETAGDGVLVKNDGSTSEQATTSISDDGSNLAQHPDITNQGLPMPTYVPLFPNESIGASLNVGSATPVTGGFQYHFTAKIKNYGNVNLDSIRIEYNFNELYPAPDQASLVGTPTITRGNIVYNTNSYDGYNDVYLFKYGGDLQVGDSATYEYDLKVTTAKAAYTWPNYFVAYGRSVNSGVFVNDTSMAGIDPDPNNDNDPIEKFLTGVTINYERPAPPTVDNKTYNYGDTKPANIGGLVRSTPTGTIPVWCDTKTAACSVTPPPTPTEIGKYIYALRSYDTTTLLYSEVLVYDTVIIRPPVPVVVNKKYIIGASANPNNVSGQVTGMTGSTLKYFKNAGVLNAIPTLGVVPGVTRYTTSQTVNAIESDTVGFTVTMLDPKTMLHLQKIAEEPRLQTNSTFNITYTFLVNNRTDEPMSNVLVVDNLQNTFPQPTAFTKVSLSSTGGLVTNNGFNGMSDINLLSGTSSLAAFAMDTIRLTINLQPKGYTGTVNNLAVITATTPYGVINMNSSSQSFANETSKTPTSSVIPDLTIDIPEAFSPNRDGVNDRFVILKPFGTTIELEVFNRWGNVVYANGNYNNEWDGRGTNNFIGQDLMDGGYYYTLKAKSVNGNIQIFKGFVLIQR
ncbi:MAG: gliding motility-associated C-terminal domain-containing protein [Sediminibacterium sp.]|nr:gliding motility-associated C-terminal domain-containing protein [Sediminibacterium sp.]